jgi:hypothetical protein
LSRLACGACKSRLEQTKPVARAGKGKENKANPFAEFVKGNFAGVKKENPGMKHKEIMGVLGKMYREEKDGGGGGEGKEVIVIEESEDEIGEAATALENLNLQ